MFTMWPFRNAGQAWIDNIQALFPMFGASPLQAQQIIRLFREAGAITPDTAQRFCSRSTIEDQTFLHLLSLDVIRQPAPGRYYLDEQRLEAVPLQSILPWR